MKVLLKRLEAGLRSLSPLTNTILAVGGVLALGIADYYTPGSFTLLAFYILAVVFAGWGAGKWHACFVSGVAAMTMFTVYWVLQRGVPHSIWAAAWNNGTRFVVFSLAGWMAAEMTRLTRGLERQVEERTAQWRKEAEEHKLTATRLTDTIERFEQVINNITEVFWLTNLSKNQMVYISPGYEHIWGRKCQELYQDPASWLACVHPEDWDTVARRSHSEQAGGGYEIEYRILRPDGAVRWVRDRAFPVRNAQGEVCRIAGVAEDITGRKQTEQTLQMQAAILENMAEGVVVTDDRGLIVQMNPAAEQIWGYPRKEVLGKPASVFSALAEPEATTVMRGVLKALEASGNWRGTFSNKRKDGTLISCEALISRVQIEGRVFMVAVEQDVTERRHAETALREAHDLLEQRVQERTAELQVRKQAEQKLAEALEFNRQVVSASTVGIGVYKASGQCVMANPAAAKIVGGSVEQLLEQDFRRIKPWAADGLLAKAEAALETRRPQELECKSRTSFGRELALSVRFSSFVAQGELHLLLMLTDQTAAMVARDALRVSEDRYRTLAESSPDAIFILDRDIQVEYVNSTAAAFWRRAPGELTGRKQPDLFPPEIAQRHEEIVREVFATGVSVRRDEPLAYPTGDQWIEVRLSPLYDAQRSVTAVMGVCRDITERKQTESLLQAQRDLGLSLSTTSDVGVALRRFLEVAVQTGGFDCGGVYLVNPDTQGLDLAEHRGTSAAFAQAVAHFSASSPQTRLVRQGSPIFTLHEELGIPLDEVRRGEALQAVALLPLNHEQEMIGALVVASHTVKLIPPQTRLVIEALATQAAGALARIRAETEQHRLERQLLEITDREQARIGQDIHDGLCQRLVSLGFDANFLAQELSRERGAEAPRARRMAELADQAITETRQLARGLFPVRLESEGLTSALEELARSTRGRFKLRCRFRSKGTPTVSSSTMATHLYRIAQEAVANAVKHGQARAISIDLTAHDGQLWLKVEDDGKGLDPRRPKGADGMGLHIMDYRARSIGGTLKLARRPRGGTQVFCCIPLQSP